MARLDGNVAAITGGNSGIRLATAQRFVGERAYVQKRTGDVQMQPPHA